MIDCWSMGKSPPCWALGRVCPHCGWTILNLIPNDPPICGCRRELREDADDSDDAEVPS